MLVFNKDGVNFVTDLVWQKQTENNKITLKKYRTECKFDYYCRTSKIATTYGFARALKDKDDKPVLIKNPTSLAIYIIESVDVDAEADLFICFKFSAPTDIGEPLYGYILLYRGSVAPEDGEFVGSLIDVESRIETVAKRYGTKWAFITDDVPFHANANFASRTGLEVAVLQSKPDPKTGIRVPASEYSFWSRNRKRKVQAGRIKSMAGLDKQKKVILAGIGVALLLCVGIFVKSTYFAEDDITQIAAKVTQTPAPTAYTAASLINVCLAKYDKLVISTPTWSTANFKCNAKGIDVSYLSNGGSLGELAKLTGESAIVYAPNGASLHTSINVQRLLPGSYQGKNLGGAIDALTNAADKLQFKATITQNRFDVQSSYSPIFLFQNGIINQFNLSDISVVPTQDGFYTWSLKGEFNVKN